MSSIKAFKESKARPDSFLENHLKDVKISIEHYLTDYDKELVRLVGLAGVCHDIGKNHIKWQDYIDNESKTKGPNHSDFGAFVFSYLGFHLLNQQNLWEEYQVQWLWLIRDIADHHSKLKNLTNDNWIISYDWNKHDLFGMENFIHELYEELIDTPINKEELDNWIDIVGEHIEDVEFVLYSEEEDKELLELAIELQKWRILTTSLIMGDRFNVKNVESTWITKTDNSRYVENIDRFCSQNRDQPLSVVRMKAQEDIMRQLKENPNQLFYTLCMPTGERVIIVMGAVNVMKPRVSGTLNKYILCIA